MSVSLALLDMPFPYRKNPAYEGLADAMSGHLARHQLIEEDRHDYHTGFNLLNAFFFPEVSGERLALLSKMIDLFFLLDDIYDTSMTNGRNTALVEDLLTTNVEIILTGKLPPNPDALNRFAYQTTTELEAIQTPAQRARLAHSISDYLLKGSLELMKLWSRHEIPDVETYCKIREYDVAMYPTIDVSELASGVALDDEIYHHEVLRGIRQAANRQVGQSNDILSYHKEVLRDRCPYNVVHIVAVHGGLDLDQAVRVVIERVNRHTEELLNLEQQLPSWGEPIDGEVRRYVQGIKDLVGGHWYWSLEGSRYTSADSPFVELRTTDELLDNKSRGRLVTDYPKTRTQRHDESAKSRDAELAGPRSEDTVA